jgi:adenylosuccinate lyase
MTDYTQYLSPFSWRYSSPEMRQIWSEDNKRKLWRRVWLALAEAQATFGLISSEKLADIRTHVDDVDIPLSLEYEAKIHHDLMAELKTFASQCSIGGGVLHLGATSMDIEDNAEAIRLRQSTQLILQRLVILLRLFSARILDLQNTPCIAFTHLQPAEPTTYGARLAFYAQDLLEDYQAMLELFPRIRGKGFKGAVGTSAAYAELIGKENLVSFETDLSNRLALPFYQITSQTYPRRQEYTLLNLLASMALTLNKFAFDLRLLQSPLAGEISEPFGMSQVGSSAMPFKRNPIQSEKINSLARTLAQAPLTAWHNAAHSLLERTLDDSANRRSLLPESFLAMDEMLITAIKLIDGFQLHPVIIQRNLETFAPFSATERLLMVLARAGADRQQMHEIIREHSLIAWAEIQFGKPNPLIDLLAKEEQFTRFLTPSEIRAQLEVKDYLGDAPQRARDLAEKITTIIS